jgi:hypothetical protein
MFSFRLVDRVARGAILMSRGELCSPSSLFQASQNFLLREDVMLKSLLSLLLRL